MCDNVEDAGGDIRAHVIGALHALIKGDNVGTSYVAHVDVIALLTTVAVDRRNLSGEELFQENCNDARFSVRILARSVHVGIS